MEIDRAGAQVEAEDSHGLSDPDPLDAARPVVIVIVVVSGAGHVATDARSAAHHCPERVNDGGDGARIVDEILGDIESGAGRGDQLAGGGLEVGEPVRRSIVEALVARHSPWSMTNRATRAR